MNQKSIGSIHFFARKHRSFVLMTLVTLLIFAAIFTFLCTNELPPSLFGYRLFRVTGYSMEPTFENGSFLLVKKVSPHIIQCGDVITYFCSRSDVGLTTHRVYAIQERSCDTMAFTTRGDNNSRIDPGITESSQLVGVVVAFVKPPATYFSSGWIQSLFLEFAFALTVVYWWCRSHFNSLPMKSLKELAH